MDSIELQGFISDVREDLNNFDELFDYYKFLDDHNIRKIVFNPDNDESFFEGSVIAVLEQRYREFFRSRFNADMDDLVRIDVLEIIRTYLPIIHEKISQE
jgi:hypothetical protein